MAVMTALLASPSATVGARLDYRTDRGHARMAAGRASPRPKVVDGSADGTCADVLDRIVRPLPDCAVHAASATLSDHERLTCHRDRALAARSLRARLLALAVARRLRAHRRRSQAPPPPPQGHRGRGRRPRRHRVGRVHRPARSRRHRRGPAARVGLRRRPSASPKAPSCSRATCCSRSTRGRSRPKSIACAPSSAARDATSQRAGSELQRAERLRAENAMSREEHDRRAAFAREVDGAGRGRRGRRCAPPSSTSSSRASPRRSTAASAAPSSPKATWCRAARAKRRC